MAHEGSFSAGTYSRADALVSVCESFLADAAARTTPVPGRYEVVVHAGEGDEICELDDGSRVSAETGRRLACDAPIVGPSGERRRRPSIAQRRALHERDHSCRFPGCTCQLWVDAHHVRPWSEEGETTLENLVQLCRFHHMLVHEGGFRVEKEGEALRFFDRWGDLIPAVPKARLAEGVERMDELGSVDARTNAPLWDGSPLDYGAAVWGLLDPRQLEAGG